MTRVSHEPALALLGMIQPVEHGIHGARQPGDLVIAGRFGDPGVQLMTGDGFDARPDLLDRTQGPSHAHPRRETAEHGE